MNTTEIRARVDATTPGPWVAEGIEVWTEGESVMGGTIHTTEDGYPRGDYHPVEDAEFIAHARVDIPDALDRIEHLEAIIEMALEVGKPDMTQTNAYTQALWRMRDTLRQSGGYAVAVPLPQRSGSGVES